MKIGDEITHKVSMGHACSIEKTGHVIYINRGNGFYIAEFQGKLGPFRETFFFPLPKPDAKGSKGAYFRNRKPITTGEIRKYKELKAAKKTRDQIAELTGWTKQRVRSIQSRVCKDERRK